MKRSSSAARSSSIVIVTRCIGVSRDAAKYADLLTSSYLPINLKNGIAKAAVPAPRHHSALSERIAALLGGGGVVSFCLSVVCARGTLRVRMGADVAGHTVIRCRH